MPDQDKSSKTEEPTAKRVKDAHSEGQFAKAEEIQVVFGLCASFIAILFLSSGTGTKLAMMMSQILGNLDSVTITMDVVVEHAGLGIQFLASMIVPVLAISVLAGILAGGFQSGFKMTPKAAEWKFTKLNPVSNFQQKFGKAALVKFGIDLSKFILIGLVVLFAIFRISRHEIFHTRIAVGEIAHFIFSTVLYLISILIVALGLIALINYLYQKKKTHDDLKMSHQEVKDERKQQDGDPQVKAAQRNMARNLAQRQMFEAIPDADLVVTNPTHYAVALRYDRSRDSAPMILAKGQNLIALKIKEIARQHGVPVVENKPAARALFKIGKTGKPIPQEMFKVVAQVLAYVYRTHKRFYRQRELQRRRAQ